MAHPKIALSKYLKPVKTLSSKAQETLSVWWNWESWMWIILEYMDGFSVPKIGPYKREKVRRDMSLCCYGRWRMELWPKGYRHSVQPGKGKKTDPFLKPTEGTQLCRHDLIFLNQVCDWLILVFIAEEIMETCFIWVPERNHGEQPPYRPLDSHIAWERCFCYRWNHSGSKMACAAYLFYILTCFFIPFIPFIILHHNQPL